VLNDVRVKNIVFEIQKEFNLKGSYSLWTRRTKAELDANRTLAELNVRTGAELEFGKKATRIPAGSVEIVGPKRGYFTAEGTKQTFPIVWQPALIGRGTDAATASQLAVDLVTLDSRKSVSRQHASVSESGGQFTIQRLNQNNTVDVNGSPIGYLQPVTIGDGTAVRVGSFNMVFHVEDSEEGFVPPPSDEDEE
jgi:hypothetical protein